MMTAGLGGKMRGSELDRVLSLNLYSVSPLLCQLEAGLGTTGRSASC
jgi:hypothetical protein